MKGRLFKETKRKVHLDVCKQKFLLCLVAFSLISISCHNTPKKDVGQWESAIVGTDVMDEIAKENVDIPISVNLAHTDDEFLKQFNPAEYEIVQNTEKDLFIDINSHYYKDYMSGNRFSTSKIAYFENSEDVEYLTMTIDVVNNTNERLSINELNIVVEESKPDTIPVIYICTTEDCSNCIYFVNESWFNWKGLTFSYSILKKGESFNGHYKSCRHIPYFDKYKVINLLPDMIAMGYDFNGLIKSISNRYPYRNYEIDDAISEEDDSLYFVMFSITRDDDDFNYFEEKFKPFGLEEDIFDEYTGSATLYGSLKFDDIDYMVDFVAEISLSTAAGFGGASYENDKFDIKLRTTGNGYTLRYPYTTVIEPYGVEMVKLSVVADKSSFHKFYIDIKNDNELRIRSKDIHFHHYYPKN